MTDRDIMRDFDLSEIAAPGSEPVPAPEPIDEPMHPGLHKVPPEQIAAWLQEARKKGSRQALPAVEPAVELDSDPLPPGFHYVPPEQIAAWEREMAARKHKGRSKEAPLPAKGRPTITVVAGNLPAIVDQAEDALVKANTDLYQRGTMLVRPATATIRISNGDEITTQQLVPINLYGLVEEFSKAARWQKMGEKESYPIDCPSMIAKLYLARVGYWRLPALTGIVNCPTLREDGSILDQPGYDARTGLLFDPRACEFRPVANKPTRDDAKEALQLLRELIRKFPFADNASQSVALSAILTAVVRRTLTSAPLHAFSAPVAGSGKSMLVDIASLIATGHEAAVVEEGDVEELPKRLGAALLAGNPVLALDNIERPLGGGFLCQALTQPYLNVRILGQSENRIIVPDGVTT